MANLAANVTAPAAQRRTPQFTAAGWLQTLPNATRLIFFGDSQAQRLASTAFGVPFSSVACRAQRGAARAALWLGPDEQLLLAPAEDPATVARTLSTALGEVPHSLVDVSHRQIALQLTGPNCAWLLNSQCPLDLSMQHFPVGMCTRTVFSKVEIVLWRTAEQSFHVEIFRSQADYLVSFLQKVATELA